MRNCRTGQTRLLRLFLCLCVCLWCHDLSNYPDLSHHLSPSPITHYLFPFTTYPAPPTIRTSKAPSDHVRIYLISYSTNKLHMRHSSMAPPHDESSAKAQTQPDEAGTSPAANPPLLAARLLTHPTSPENKPTLPGIGTGAGTVKRQGQG